MIRVFLLSSGGGKERERSPECVREAAHYMGRGAHLIRNTDFGFVFAREISHDPENGGSSVVEITSCGDYDAFVGDQPLFTPPLRTRELEPGVCLKIKDEERSASLVLRPKSSDDPTRSVRVSFRLGDSPAPPIEVEIRGEIEPDIDNLDWEEIDARFLSPLPQEIELSS